MPDTYNDYNNSAYRIHAAHAEQIEPLISLYQDGEASRSERQIVEEFLATCDYCRATMESYQRLEARLSSFYNSIAVPRFVPQNYSFNEADEAGYIPPAVKPLPTLTADQDDEYRPERQAKKRSNRGQVIITYIIGIAAALLILVTGFLALNSITSSGGNATQVAGVDTSSSLVPAATPQPSATPTVTAAPTTRATVEIPNTVTPLPTATPEALKPTNPPVVTTQDPTTKVVPTSAPVATTAARQPTLAPTRTPLPPTTKAPVATNTPVATATPTPAPATPTETPRPATATPKDTINAAVSVSPEATTSTFSATVGIDATPTPIIATATPAATTPASSPTAAPTSPVATTAAATPTLPTTSGSVPSGLIAYVDRTDGQIHVTAADGSNNQALTNPATAGGIVWEQLVWSPDGKQLAAVGLNSARSERGIYLLDLQGAKRVDLLTTGFAPSWSADGTLLAYLAGAGNVRNSVKYGQAAIFDLKKRAPQIVSNQQDSYEPQWFADGKRLLLGQERIYNLATGQTSNFNLPFTNECIAASLSPSGDKLAALEAGNNGFDTVIYDFSDPTARLDAQKVIARIPTGARGSIGTVCGAQRLSWTPNGQNVYHYASFGGVASNCLASLASGKTRCLSNVYDPSFNSTATYLVDYSSGSGLVYVMSTDLPGRPDNVKALAETRTTPVWQPRP